MNKIFSYRNLGFLAVFGLVACSSSYTAMNGESDDMYYMASDDAVVTANAVSNNTPKNFNQYSEVEDANDYSQESFSTKNVNPEYIAKYQVQNDTVAEDIVYFDDAAVEGNTEGSGDVNVYNNFYGYSNPKGSSSWNTNPWMYSSLGFYGGPYGFYPSLGFGGFYDPFWGPGYGFRPGFNLSIGFGFGFGRPWGYRPYYSPFYDPFWGPSYAYGGYYGGYYGRPIIINNIYSPESRRIVRAASTRRGSSVTTTSTRRATSPTASRTDARRSVVSRTEASSRRAASDFSRSQNDYTNGKSRITSANPSRRTANSAVMTRPSSSERTRSVYSPSRSTTNRSVAPSTNRSTRSTYSTPSSRTRSSSPSYNRSSSPSRSTNTYSRPTSSQSSRSYTPSRSSSSTSRSSGSVSRSSGGSRRGGN